MMMANKSTILVAKTKQTANETAAMENVAIVSLLKTATPTTFPTQIDKVQYLNNKILAERTTTTTTTTTKWLFDASILSAVLLNPSRMPSSVLSITNEQTNANTKLSSSCCSKDYKNSYKHNNTSCSNKSKVWHLHMKRKHLHQDYEANGAQILYNRRQKHVSSRRLQAQRKQLHWWWCTCFVVIICLSLPSTTNMQPQDIEALPKSSQLPPSLTSRLSTSLSPTNSSLFLIQTKISRFQNIPSGTSSPAFMQSTTHSLTTDYLQQRQRRQQLHQLRNHLKLMTTLRSIYARRIRKRRSLLTSHNDSNGSSRNANLSVNNNTDNSHNSNHNNIECPSYNENSACPCYKFEDGEYK